MQYSHCSSDTARRRWAGRTGAGQDVQALGRRAGGRRRGRWGAQGGRRIGAYWQANARQAGGTGARGAQAERAREGRRRSARCWLCAQAGRAGWPAGPSWCTVHLAQF